MRKRILIAGLMLAASLGACVMMSGRIDPNETAMKITYIDAAGAAKMLATNPDMGIVDVRTKAEYNQGHIEGAVHNGFVGFGFSKRLEILDRSKAYLVTCRTGHRSIPAIKRFDKLGFTHVVHLDGGMQAWKKSKLPITK